MKMPNSFRIYTLNQESLQDNLGDRCLRVMIADGFETELSQKALHEVLIENPARDPLISQWSAWGFSAPNFFEDTLALANDQTVFFFAEKRERLLPGAVLKRAVAEEVQRVQNLQENPVNKKQIAEIKDVVVARLLPKSHIKSTIVPMMFTKVGDTVLLYVFTGSSKLAEDALAVLRSANGTLTVHPFEAHAMTPVEGLLTEVLASGIGKPTYPRILPGSSATLYHPTSGAVVYKDADLDIYTNETLKENIDAEFYCRKLQFKFMTNELVSAVLTLDAKGSFSGMKFSDFTNDLIMSRDSDGDAITNFRAHVFVLSRMLNDLHYTILLALGGAPASCKKADGDTESSNFQMGDSNLVTDFGLDDDDDDDDDDNNYYDDDYDDDYEL